MLIEAVELDQENETPIDFVTVLMKTATQCEDREIR